MPEIEGIGFPDSVTDVVRRLVAELRSVAGQSAVYGANNQIRAAVDGATDTHKGHGVFLMIEPRSKGAAVWFPSFLGFGDKRRELSLESYPLIVTQMATSYAAVKAKLKERERGPASKAEPVKALTRNPAWTRDELILTLDVYFRVPPWTVSSRHAEVHRLSEELQLLSAHVDPPDAGRYRNLNGTYMKLMNFQSLDPTRGGRGLKSAGRADREVWEDYSSRRERLIRDAAAIRAALDNPYLLKTIESTPDEDDITEAIEGRVLTRLHRSRERNSKLAEAKRNKVMKEVGALCCEVCLFDFYKRYGHLGLGYLECHHIRPLAELPEHTKTTLEDLALVCANCHRMLHRRKNWLSIEALRKMLTA